MFVLNGQWPIDIMIKLNEICKDYILFYVMTLGNIMMMIIITKRLIINFIAIDLLFVIISNEHIQIIHAEPIARGTYHCNPAFHLYHKAFTTETVLIHKLLARTKRSKALSESCGFCKSSLDPTVGHLWLMEQHIL